MDSQILMLLTDWHYAIAGFFSLAAWLKTRKWPKPTDGGALPGCRWWTGLCGYFLLMRHARSQRFSSGILTLGTAHVPRLPVRRSAGFGCEPYAQASSSSSTTVSLVPVASDATCSRPPIRSARAVMLRNPTLKPASCTASTSNPTPSSLMHTCS